MAVSTSNQSPVAPAGPDDNDDLGVQESLINDISSIQPSSLPTVSPAHQPNNTPNGGRKGLDENSLERYQSTKNQLNSQGDSSAKSKVDQKKEKAEEAMKSEASKVLKKEASVMAKAAAREVWVAVAGFFAATWEIWVGLIIIVVLFGAFSFFTGGYFHGSGGSGGGFPRYPASAQERQQVSALGALTGSQLSDNQLVAKTIANEQTRLTNAKATIQKVYASDPARATAASTDLDTIIKAMTDVANQPLLDKRKAIIDAVTVQLQDYSTKYPEVLGYGAVNGGYLNVPGVMEATGGACGQASTVMVILYYNPTYSDSTYYIASNHITNGKNTSCVLPDYISNNNTRATDWTWTTSSQTPPQKIKESLAGGDPVIVYTKPGSVYPNSPHIFVLVGYDPVDDTFIVNNPGVNHIEVHTKTPNGVPMSATHLSQYLDNPDYGHSYMIRKKYL